MSREAARQLEVHLREAFEGTPQFLLANLEPLRAEDGTNIPAGGARSILDILQHTAVAKHLYVEHTFGAAARHYRDLLELAPGEPAAPVAWLQEAHEELLVRTARLADADLANRCGTHWGGTATVGRILRLAAHTTSTTPGRSTT